MKIKTNYFILGNKSGENDMLTKRNVLEINKQAHYDNV